MLNGYDCAEKFVIMQREGFAHGQWGYQVGIEVSNLINIGLDETVYDLVSRYDEIRDIMVEAGFGNITKPGMLQSVGRVMTIRKGAVMKGIDIGDIKALFLQHGFILEE